MLQDDVCFKIPASMAKHGVEVSIIIPCYNEGPTFEMSVGKIISVCRSLKMAWEIIFVEDKSTDETRKKVEKLVAKISNARAIYHPQNQGRGKGVSDGIKASRGKICGFLDVDLEVSAGYIPLFVDEIKSGADMAVGRRFYEGGELFSVLRLIGSKAYARMVRALLAIPIDDTEAGYKFFRREKILPVLSRVRDKRWFWDTEICARAVWANLAISQVPVLFVRRPEKKSTVRLVPDTLEYLRKIIEFRSQIPKAREA